MSDAPQGWLAAEIRLEHYEKSDAPIASAAAALGIDIVGLADSSGNRP